VVGDVVMRARITPEWIVCAGGARSVVDGVVTCPLGTFSAWTDCLACHALEGVQDDRDRARFCSTEPVAHQADAKPTTPTGSWAELIIELL
jgi:hypothetical protein